MNLKDILTIFGSGKKTEPILMDTKPPKQKGLLGISNDIFQPSNTLVNEKSVSSKVMKANDGWVYANVSAIARAVSNIELKLFTTRIVGGKVDMVEIEDHPLLDVIERFNTMLSQTDAIYTTQSHLELAGDAFWLLDNKGRNIKNIYILEPDKITVNFDMSAEGIEITSYTYKNTIDGKHIEINYTPDQIIHFKVPDPNNPVRGKSVVQAAAGIIDIDNMAEEYNKQLFIRGAIQKFVLSTDKAITEDDMKRLEMKLQKNYAGVANAHKTLILQGGLKPEKITDTNRDMEFSIQQQWARDKITNLFGNNKAVLGVVEDVNRSNADATIDQWLKQNIKPKMKRLCDTLNEFLLPQFGTNLLITFEDPAPENKLDTMAEVQTYYTNATRQVISLNEARDMIGLEPTDNPDDDIVRQDQPDTTQPNQDPNAQDQQDVPKAVKNVNYKAVLRRNGIYKELQTKTRLKAEAKKMLASTKPKQAKTEAEVLPVRRGNAQFSQEELLAYWKKIDYISSSREKAFKEKVVRFIEQIETKVMAVVSTIETKGLRKAADYELFSMNEEVTSGIDLFKPLYTELVNLSGQEAYRLIKYMKAYKPSAEVIDSITNHTENFIKSMLATDKERLLNILIDGIANGQGIDKISQELRSTFADIKKYQSERVARTETIRASNMAADDAFAQSGVVEAKEWLTAGAPCPECAPYDGQVIELGGNYFTPDDFTEGDPPLHPNCRCVIIPVVKSVDEKQISELNELKDYVAQLEQLLEIDNG